MTGPESSDRDDTLETANTDGEKDENLNKVDEDDVVKATDEEDAEGETEEKQAA